MVKYIIYSVLILLISCQGWFADLAQNPSAKAENPDRAGCILAQNPVPCMSGVCNPRPVKSSGVFRFIPIAGILQNSLNSPVCDSSSRPQSISGIPVSLDYSHTLVALGCQLTV